MTNTEKKMRGERGAGAHWQMLHLQADTMAAAKDMARSTGRWRVARRGQGDGKRTLVLECNEHINCEVKRRVALAKDNMFHVFELGEHAQTENTKKRKNSALDVEQEKELLCDIWKGVRSAGSRLAMTLSKESELFEAGKDPSDYNPCSIQQNICILCILQVYICSILYYILIYLRHVHPHRRTRRA